MRGVLGGVLWFRVAGTRSPFACTTLDSFMQALNLQVVRPLRRML